MNLTTSTLGAPIRQSEHGNVANPGESNISPYRRHGDQYTQGPFTMETVICFRDMLPLPSRLRYDNATEAAYRDTRKAKRHTALIDSGSESDTAIRSGQRHDPLGDSKSHQSVTKRYAETQNPYSTEQYPSRDSSSTQPTISPSLPQETSSRRDSVRNSLSTAKSAITFRFHHLKASLKNPFVRVGKLKELPLNFGKQLINAIPDTGATQNVMSQTCLKTLYVNGVMSKANKVSDAGRNINFSMANGEHVKLWVKSRYRALSRKARGQLWRSCSTSAPIWPITSRLY